MQPADQIKDLKCNRLKQALPKISFLLTLQLQFDTKFNKNLTPKFHAGADSSFSF